MTPLLSMARRSYTGDDAEQRSVSMGIQADSRGGARLIALDNHNVRRGGCLPRPIAARVARISPRHWPDRELTVEPFSLPRLAGARGLDHALKSFRQQPRCCACPHSVQVSERLRSPPVSVAGGGVSWGSGRSLARRNLTWRTRPENSLSVTRVVATLRHDCCSRRVAPARSERLPFTSFARVQVETQVDRVARPKTSICHYFDLGPNPAARKRSSSHVVTEANHKRLSSHSSGTACSNVARSPGWCSAARRPEPDHLSRTSGDESDDVRGGGGGATCGWGPCLSEEESLQRALNRLGWGLTALSCCGLPVRSRGLRGCPDSCWDEARSVAAAGEGDARAKRAVPHDR